MESNGGRPLERLATSQEDAALETFRRLREESIQRFSAAMDARSRGLEAKALVASAQRELDNEERETSRLPIRNGVRVPPHPDMLRYRDHRRAEAERLEAEAVKANERAQVLGQLVEACRRELMSRGLDPDRTQPRRSNARGVRPRFEQQRAAR